MLACVSRHSEDNRIMQQDGIHISEVTEADEGTYRCRARVPALGSMKQMEIQVEVNIPPVINIPPENVTGKEHEEVVFQCGATGKPAPEYSWVDNNNMLLENGDEVHMNSETGVLKLMNLRPEQSGEYRCTATNSAGEDFKTAHLQVVYFVQMYCSLYCFITIYLYSNIVFVWKFKCIYICT